MTRGANPTYVVHPDPALMMSVRPTGATGAATHALSGFEGTIESVNLSGASGLYAFKSLKEVNWSLPRSSLPARHSRHWWRRNGATCGCA